ncbi:MAG: SpoIIE family protein phosphatase [Atopobiaceae bacterium]|nr:SpoIIE family protein phosphatase [Atopobiaceae bacterium]
MPFVVYQFILATLLPVVASAALYLIDRDRGLSKRAPILWQLVVGIVFGLVAVVGTELGIETPDAIMNVRDAAPLVAGLVFGGPAGIVAGVIGGIERWFAALWGRGMFTRVACSVATGLAGLYAALMRRFMFDDKRPPWAIAAAVGLVNEVLHLTLIFITNFDQAQRAYRVAQACAFPMIACNTISAGLSVFVVTLLAKEDIFLMGEHLPISEAIQRGMLVSTLFAFVVTTSFTTILQTSLADASTSSLLELNIDDVREDIMRASNVNLLSLTRHAAALVPTVEGTTPEKLEDVKDQLQVTEVSVVNSMGFVEASTDSSVLNFNFRSGSQANEFVELLDGTLTAYAQEFCGRTIDGQLRKYAAVTIDGGFIQVGNDVEHLQSGLNEQVESSVDNRHVGEGGFLLVFDYADEMSGGYLFGLHGDSDVQSSKAYLLDRLSTTRPATIFSLSFLGDDYYAMFDNVEGYKVVAMLPASESDFSRNVAILVGTFTEIIVFALLYLAIYIVINRDVVGGIRGINARLNQIADGNLDTVVDVRSSVEFAQLSDDINITVDVLKRYISDAESRIDQELEYARAIQSSALPSVFLPFPNHDEFDIYALMRPAKVVGGDFFDFYFTDERHLAFLVADVSGKSIPGALFMMRAKAIIKSLADTGLPVERVFEEANNDLCSGNESNMFVTALMGVLDVETGHVWLVNAGHNPPALYLSEGDGYELLKLKRGLFLGCMEGVPYRVNELQLEHGDTLFLYTDGVVEANDASESLYGDERLVNALNALRGREPKDVCELLLEDVDGFVGAAEQFDDITMLALRYNGFFQSE